MDTEMRELSETPVSSEELFQGKILHLYRDTVRLPNGKPVGRELIRHVGAVCVVPLTEDGRVVVERQYRYPVNQVITEIPAGKLNFREEDREAAIRRELREETGAEAQELICLGPLYPACAYSDESITMYLAKGLTFGSRDLDEDEFLNVQLVPLEELVRDIMDGKIPDAKTQAAVLRVYLMEKTAKEGAGRA